MKAGCNLSFRPLLPVAPVQAWAHVSQWLDRFRLCCSVLAPACDTHFHRLSCSLSREHAHSAVDGAHGGKAIFPIRPGGPRRQGEERPEGRAALCWVPLPQPLAPSPHLHCWVCRSPGQQHCSPGLQGLRKTAELRALKLLVTHFPSMESPLLSQAQGHLAHPSLLFNPKELVSTASKSLWGEIIKRPLFATSGR